MPSDIECKRCAILLVNVQNDYLKEKGATYPKMKFPPKILENMSEIVEVARSKGIHVIHAPQDSLELYKPINSIVTGYLKTQLEEKALMSKSWGVKSVEDVTSEADIVIQGRKGMDSFAGTNLQNVLQTKNVDTLVIMGFTTNGAVYSTAASAYVKGFRVYAVADCTASYSTQEQISTETLLTKVSLTCSTNELLTMLQDAE